MQRKKIVGIIQARMGSSRLPGKVLLPMGLMNTSLSFTADHVKEGLSQFCNKNPNYTYEVVIATTTNKLDAAIVYYTQKYLGIKYFRGSEENVLGRTYECAQKHKADIIVDVTSDCPFVQPHLIAYCTQRLVNKNLDYYSNVVDRSYPDGLDTQVYTFDTLVDLFYHEEAVHEHSGWNAVLLTKELKLKISMLKAEDKFNYPDWRWTLDTIEDYILLSRMVRVIEDRSRECKDVQDFSIENLKEIYLGIQEGRL